MAIKKLYIFLCFTFFMLNYSLELKAQSGHAVSVTAMPGYLLAHRPDLKNIESHALAFALQYEVDYSQTTWGRSYNRPVAGFGVDYFHFGNALSGSAIALHGNIKFDLFRRNDHAIAFRMGAGLGYLTKKFDLESNRRNQAIGSHLNGFMQTAFLYEHTMPKGEWACGFGMSHFSNGAFRMPNLGLNLPTVFAKYSFELNEACLLKKESTGSPWWSDTGKWDLSALAILTRKERNLSRPANFTIFGVQLRALNHRSTKNTWRIGLDLMSDKTYAYVKNSEVNLDSLSWYNQMELGIAAGNSWSLGRVQFMAEVGTYVFRPGTYKRKVYERIGFTYHINEHFGLQTTLKFHRAVADYFEWGIMYRL